MDYRKLSDEMLIEQIRDGNTDATDTLMERYKNMVRSKTKLLFLVGGDKDDLNQEGMIGLFKAICNYDADKNDTFAAFAALCIDHQMYQAIEKSQRQKNAPLNSYVSITSPEGEEKNWDELNTTSSAKGLTRSPEELYIARETESLLLKKIEDSLSSKERKVFELSLDGMNYRQIAEELGISTKSVDNALQRIKKKMEGLV